MQREVSSPAVLKESKARAAKQTVPIHDRVITSFLYRLVVAIRRSRSLASRRLMGLTGFEWDFVTRVGETEPVMLIDLTARLDIDKSQGSRAVRRLLAEGFVLRRGTRGPIELTSKGREAYDLGRRWMRAQNVGLARGISKSEMMTFLRIFPKLSANAQRMLESEQALMDAANAAPVQNSRFLETRQSRILPIPMLIGLYNVIRQSGDYAYKRSLALGDFDWRVLSRAGADAQITLANLVTELDRDKSQVGRSVKRLTARGIFKPMKSEAKRRVTIAMTDEGRRAYAQLARIAFDRHEALIEGLSPRELKKLMQLLDRLATNASVSLAREQALAQANQTN